MNIKQKNNIKKVIWVFISLIVIAYISWFSYKEYYRYTFFSEVQGSILATSTVNDNTNSALYKTEDNSLYLFPENTYSYITVDPKNENFFYGSDFDGIYHFEVEYVKNTDENINEPNEIKIISSDLVFNFENLKKYSLSDPKIKKPHVTLSRYPVHSLSIIPDTNSLSFIHGENIFKYDRDTKKFEIIIENINEEDRGYWETTQKMVWINDKEMFYIKYVKGNAKYARGFTALAKYNIETKEEIRIAEDIANFGISSNKKYLATIGPLERLDKSSSKPTLIDIATGAEKEMDFLDDVYFSESADVQPSNDGKHIRLSTGDTWIYEFRFGFDEYIGLPNYGRRTCFEWSEYHN